jgi:glycosyltransferase involved in cell wall biosynthesis
MDDDNRATFILIVQDNVKTIDNVMEYLIEDFMENDELIVVLNNSTDSSESKIDKHLLKLPNTNTKFLIANSSPVKEFNIGEALEVGKENSSNSLNFIVYGTEYAPVEWTKDE